MTSPLRGNLAQAAVFILFSWLAMPLLNAQTLDHGINPTNLGKGDWIYQMSVCETALGVSTPQAVLNYEAAKGVQWVAVKGADGGNTNGYTQFNATLIAQAHAAGLKIFAWAAAYGNNTPGTSVQSEINAALTLLGEGADGFIIDAESVYETNATRYSDAATYCKAIKAAYPNTFLAHSPYPYITGHSNFPYAVFGYYCDAVMPQDYWGNLKNISPAQMVADMDNEWNNWQNSLTGTNINAIKPIVPIGEGYDFSGYTETASEITNFVYLLKNDPSPAGKGGYNGASFWSCQYHTAADWQGIASSSIGSAAVTAPQIVNCQFNGNGQFILNLRGQPGGNITIFSSTDLANWSAITNLANPSGASQFTDYTATNNPRKFYRAAPSY